MNARQTRAACYAVMFAMVACDWTMVGAALFLAMMDYADCG